VAELRAAKLDNFNLDLMYALPQQTPEEALEDVRTACALEPAHISYYQLTLEPGTVFHARPPTLPDEDVAWRIQAAGQALLADAGYVQYEVSAYARSGKRCRHNLNYWLFGDYFGIGAGAHGKLTLELPQGILRTVKPKQPREYQEQVRRAGAGDGSANIGGASIGESSLIAPADLPFEFMLNALRLNEGFSAGDYRRRTGFELASVTGKLAEAEARGLLASQADAWRPTELGRRFLNDLLLGFLA
jgi:oxygen-independent coproporphyrinogen-3 oxidase